MGKSPDLVPGKKPLYDAIREEHDLKKSVYRKKLQEHARLTAELHDLWADVQNLHQVGWSCLKGRRPGCPFGDESPPPPSDSRTARSYALEVLQSADGPMTVAEIAAAAVDIGWRSESKNLSASIRALLQRMISEELVHRGDDGYVVASKRGVE